MGAVAIVLAASAVIAFGSAQPGDAGLMTRRQFAAKVAEALRAGDPRASTEIVSDDTLRVTRADGWKGTIHLANAYERYRRDPAALAHIVETEVRLHLESTSPARPTDGATRILPVFRSREWFDNSLKRLRATGVPESTLGAGTPLNRELMLMFVEDRNASMRFLGGPDLERLGLSLDAARQVALTNLRRLRADKMSAEGHDGRYRVQGALEYESSLALDDEWLRSPEFGLKGDPVVAIPSRSMILFTDQRSREGLATLRTVARRIYEGAGPAGISAELFVWHAGELRVLEER